MARNPDDYFADLTAGGGATESKPRYAPAPKTADEADARLAEVNAAEAEIAAWAESKRLKKGAPKQAAQPAPEAKPAEKKPRSADDYFADLMPPPAPPKPPEKPGLLTRIGDNIAATSAKQEPINQATPGLGSVSDEMTAAVSEPQGLAAVGGMAKGQRPLPDGVQPSNAGGGRGYVRESGGARQAFSSGSQPFRDRREAIDEAVNLLDEGVDPQKVYDSFRTSGFQITRPEIEARGVARGSPFFAPQTTRPANNELLAGQGGSDSIKPDDIGVVRDVANTVGRGAEQFKQSIDAAQFQSGGIGASDMAERMRTGQRRMGKMAPSDATQAGLDRLQEADKGGWGAVLSAVAEPRNWRALASMVGESAVATAPAIVVNGIAQALTGGLGGMPAAAATTFAQEYTAALAEELAKRGIDTSDAARVAAALSDPDIRAAIDERGRIRGAAVGAFGALTMGVAGSIGRTMSRLNAAGKLSAGRAAGGAAAGAAAGVGGDMAGEVVAQRGVGEDKPLEVLVEGLAGAPGGIAEVATAFLSARNKPNGPALPPSQARSASIDRFGELAAGFGLPERALAKAREAAANMPAGDVPQFLAKLADAYNRRGMFAKPLEPQAITELQAAIDGPAEAPAEKPADATQQTEAVDNIAAILKNAGLVDETLDTPGLAEAPAEPAPVEGEQINRNWTAFSPESGTLNIPRSQMPQVAAEHRGALVNFLNARGVSHEMATVDPAELKPTQAEFEPKKVAAIAEKPSGRSLLVSADGHILDGHHQWLAAREKGEPVRVVRLDADIQDLLRLAHQFPSSTTAKGPTRKAADDQSVVPVAPAVAAGTADAGSAAGPRGSGNQRPDAAVNGRSDPAAAAPVPGGGTAGAVGDGGGPDAALNAATAATPDAAAPAAPAARQLGSYGRTPGNATPIELRPNADGTLTPYTGKYPMVDYESGDPIVIPADASDAEAVDAIRAAKAVVPKDKFFGLKGASKGDAAPTAQPDTVADADPVQADAEAPAPTREQQVAAARKRIDGLKALLSCLSK